MNRSRIFFWDELSFCLAEPTLALECRHFPCVPLISHDGTPLVIFWSLTKHLQSLKQRWRSLDRNALARQNTPALHAGDADYINLGYTYTQFASRCSGNWTHIRCCEMGFRISRFHGVTQQHHNGHHKPLRNKKHPVDKFWYLIEKPQL